MLISTFLLSDLKQLVTLVTTGDSQKYIYIGGEYGRQLNVIDFCIGGEYGRQLNVIDF